MRNIAIVALLLALACAAGLAQLSSVATHNPFTTKANFTGPDSLKPYLNDQGVRTVWADDIDNDGKLEILATDYSNNGRVHVFKFTSPNKLELVWSSPRYPSAGVSVPRWVRTGDLDGNGMKEIIFPIGPTYAGAVEVFQYNGAGGYGATPGQPDLILPATQFVPTLGAASAFRMNREVAEVYDFDGDGRDELILANQDGKVYVLGVVGDIGGFGSWGIEGGDPAVNPENGFSGGSWWHSIHADIDGDGKQEIVNHYWNHYGFWSIDPKGHDSYRYPTPGADSLTNPKAKNQFYHEYMPNDPDHDAVAYMGVQRVDVDGDGKDEIAGIIYIGGSPLDYSVSLTSLARSDTGVYVWRDSTQFGLIGQGLMPVAGGELWGIGAYDFNGNGRQEILLGGYGGYDVISLEYKGTGSILDAANYTKTIPYAGDGLNYQIFTFSDSLGAKKDTIKTETPFVSKMWAGKGITGTNDENLVLAYQSAYDSLSMTWRHWDTTLTPVKGWTTDSTKKVKNANALNVRLLKWTGSSFVPINIQTVTPDDYVLEQNYPNPFNPSTELRFSLPVDKKVSLTVYDMLGQEVKTLVADQEYTSGSHTIAWDGTNNAGKSVASGSYVYTLKFGNFQKSQKMMLVR
jgi:FlgD Ig-like domain/FG-GAP-like repeat